MPRSSTTIPRIRRPPERELWDLHLRQGLSTYQIAEHYGVSQSLVQRWLESLGLNARKRAHTEALRAPVRRQRRRHQYVPATLARRAQVHGVGALADIYGVDRKTMRRWLAREGITAVDGRRPSHPPVTELQAMRDEGMTLAAIGERYGVSRQRVWQWLNDG